VSRVIAIVAWPRGSWTTFGWTPYEIGLEVSGRVDLDTDLGLKVCKSLKANRLGLSFGYMVKESRELEDRGRELLALDVYEISATPSPANDRTRLLSTKSVEDYSSMSVEELRKPSLDLIAGIDKGPRADHQVP
jgi:HK97 family phage prohead protease